MSLVKVQPDSDDESKSIVDLIRCELSSETLHHMDELAYGLADDGDLGAARIVEDLAGISGKYTDHREIEDIEKLLGLFADAAVTQVYLEDSIQTFESKNQGNDARVAIFRKIVRTIEDFTTSLNEQTRELEKTESPETL